MLSIFKDGSFHNLGDESLAHVYMRFTVYDQTCKNGYHRERVQTWPDNANRNIYCLVIKKHKS